MSNNTANRYPLEFRQSSAKLAVESDQSVMQTARDLGISHKTLHNWIAKYSTSASDIENRAENSKIRELQKQLAAVTRERDLLKKATAYFASQSK